MRNRRTVRSHAALAGAVALAAVAACQSPAEPSGPDVLSGETLEARIDDGVTFLTMKVEMSDHMSALFEGRVVADEAGCLRLDGPDPATVVWPVGYTFQEAGGAVRILDADGSVLGPVGGEFSLGGGEVETLHDGLGFTQADRDLAEEVCPGKYWIVSPE